MQLVCLTAGFPSLSEPVMQAVILCSMFLCKAFILEVPVVLLLGLIAGVIDQHAELVLL